jgi:predicted hotdog family 3-hydroxylacyl-ACP dehydratase
MVSQARATYSGQVMRKHNRNVIRAFLLLGTTVSIACAPAARPATNSEIPRDGRGEPILSQVEPRGRT